MSKRKGKDITGIFLLNKDKGISSNKALQQVKRFYNAKKAGHTGSLDPMATGLLPICFGKATKICQYLLDSDKKYEAEIQLGEQTDTGDIEGSIINCKDVPKLSTEMIQSVLKSFIGEIKQTPPMYSALKKDGVPLYKLARKGIEVERKVRDISIYELVFIHYDNNKFRIKIEVKCSKGTYIRSLAEDIASKLNCFGHLISLNRTECGIFNIKNSIQYDNLTTCGSNLENIVSVESAFIDKSIVFINKENYDFFIKTGLLKCDIPNENGTYRLYIKDNNNDVFIGVVCFENGKILSRQLFI